MQRTKRARKKHVRMVDEVPMESQKCTSSTRKTSSTGFQIERAEHGLLQEKGQRRQPSHDTVRTVSGREASLVSARRQIAHDRDRARVYATERMAENLERTLAIDRRKRRTSRIAEYNPISLTYNFFRDPVLRFWFGCNACFVTSLLVGSGLFLVLLYPSFRSMTKY